MTNVGSSRFDFPVAGRYFEKEWFRLVYEDSVNSVGESQSLQKVPFAGSSTIDGLNRWTELTLLLLGDPELRIYTGLPRTLNVTHVASQPASDSTISVNVEDRRDAALSRVRRGLQGRRRVPVRLHERRRQHRAAVPRRTASAR